MPIGFRFVSGYLIIHHQERNEVLISFSPCEVIVVTFRWMDSANDFGSTKSRMECRWSLVPTPGALLWVC
jgi:hypothetical protein